MNHRTYLSLAIPLTISTMTTPLLGAVDTAMVGRLDNPAMIGGVAVGTLIFNTIYWLFGFLRVSTSAFSAQASGANDEYESVMALVRPFLFAALIGLIFVGIQYPIIQGAFYLYNPSADVVQAAREYFEIRIWGAPFTLINYVILGWMMGKSMIRICLFLQILMNVFNIALSLVFVLIFKWGVAGVAYSTLISEGAIFLVGLFIAWKALPQIRHYVSFNQVWDTSSFRNMMVMNRDLFIRTVCLLTVFNLFTAKGAEFGTETLAANAVLIQIHFLIAYFFDGFANASSILTGKSIGARDEALYKKTISLSFQWSLYTSCTLALFYLINKSWIVHTFTNIPSVLALSQQYGNWILLFPLSASFGLVFYGIFTGAAQAGYVRNSMILSLVLFLVVQAIAVPIIGNHGLWLAFIIFSLGRSVFLLAYIPRLNRQFLPIWNS